MAASATLPGGRKAPFQTLFWRVLLLALAVAGSEQMAAAQTPAPDDRAVLEGRVWQFTTQAYKEAALNILLEEVNGAAHVLHLSERLPIRSADLVEVGITPPGL